MRSWTKARAMAIVAAAGGIAIASAHGTPPRAHAQDARGRAARESLSRALDAYGSGQLDVALAGFEAALRTPRTEPSEVAQIHLHLGVLRASLGDDSAAARAFELALAIDPALEAPSELSPPLRASFERARRARRGRPMRVRIDATAARAHVAVYAAPVGLVARVEVRIEDSAEQVGARGGDVALDERVWGDRSSLAIAADALDESGNVVARGSANVARAPRAALAQGGASGEGESARDDGGVSGWVWVGGGALAIAAATVAILLVTAEDRYVLGEPMPR